MARLVPDPEPLTPEDRWWQDQADEWQRTALPRTREAADTWLKALGSITGLLAIVTLFKGPENVQGLPTGARTAVGVLMLLALILALGAMGVAAQAATGAVRTTRSTFAALRARAEAELRSANRQLTLSRRLAVASLVPLLVAVGLAWYVPRTAKVLVLERTDGTTVCLPGTAALTLPAGDLRAARSADACPR